MISKSLFAIVALSMVIFAPIAQFGCFNAILGVTFFKSLFFNLKNAPPLAVIMSLEMSFKSHFASKKFSAECSLSMGVIFAPLKNLPATTRLSLFARAKFLLSSFVLRLARSPAKPTIALSTRLSSQISSIFSSPFCPTKMRFLSNFTPVLSAFSPMQTNFG